jgi:phosphoribosyl-AMP cyclohydrolase
LLALVTQEGPACHTNRRSCFYTSVQDGERVVISEPL